MFFAVGFFVFKIDSDPIYLGSKFFNCMFFVTQFEKMGLAMRHKYSMSPDFCAFLYDHFFPIFVWILIFFHIFDEGSGPIFGYCAHH